MDVDREVPGRGPSVRIVGALTGFVLLALGVLVVADNYRIGAGWAVDGPEAGYFPLRVGVLIAIASAVVIVQSLRRRDDAVFVEWRKLVPVSKILVPLALYVVAMQYVGLYVASAIFVGGLMRWLGKYGWTKTILVPGIMSAVIFWLFEIQFAVPLPKGPLEAMFGY